MLRVGHFRTEQAPALYPIYRQVTDRLGHCRFAPSTTAFAAALEHPAPAGTELFVAVDAGAARGFAAVRPLPANDRRPARTEITALFVADEATGEALLVACLARAGELGRGTLLAFPDAHDCCPIPAYNAGWGGLSDGLPLVARLLARHGFMPYYRELHLALAHWRPNSPSSPPPGVTFAATSPVGRHEGRRWQAVRDGVQIGVCDTSTLAHLTDDPAAARWGYVHWLHVEEGQRRKGIGRALLTTALADLADRGCAGCWLTTGAANWPAQPLYLSLGFAVVDTSACFQKALAPT